MKTKFHLSALAALALMTAACGGDDHWKVTGTVTGADGHLLTLERSFNGRWMTLDSTRLDAKGNYKLQSTPVGYPDIYRLTLDGKSAYFPIDSIETVTLSGDAATFTTGYTLSGSDNAVMMQQANTLINDAVAALGRDAAPADSMLKRELSALVLGDMSSIVSYYIVNKEIDGHPIFNPADKADMRVIGAVVNAFSAFRPNDPRTRVMEQQYLALRRAMNTAAGQTVEAIEVGFPEIELKDISGTVRPLSSVTGNGKPVILNFTAYAADSSPALNLILANIYNEGGVEVYQVSVDADEYLWREAARNLPWITVFNSPSDGDRVLMEYNVAVIPQTFIIDRQGRLAERVAETTQLPELIKKYR